MYVPLVIAFLMSLACVCGLCAMLFGAMKSRSLAPGSLGLRTKWTTRSDHAWVEGHYAAWPYVRAAMQWSLVMLLVAGIFVASGASGAAVFFGCVGYLMVWWFLRAAAHEANQVARKVLREPEPEPKIKPGKLIELKKHEATGKPASLGEPSGKSAKKPSPAPASEPKATPAKVSKLPAEPAGEPGGQRAAEPEGTAQAEPGRPRGTEPEAHRKPRPQPAAKVSKLPKKVSKLSEGEAH